MLCGELNYPCFLYIFKKLLEKETVKKINGPFSDSDFKTSLNKAWILIEKAAFHYIHVKNTCVEINTTNMIYEEKIIHTGL